MAGRPLAALLGIALAGWVAAAQAACPATPHRFETHSLPAPSLGLTKRVVVYLPPGYDCTGRRRYPLLVANDGQDLFDWSPFAGELDPAVAADIAARESWYGSWRLESQLDAAVTQGLLPAMVVVAIASDDGWRSRDLAPVPWGQSDEARGADYAAFVVDSVVPLALARYRLREDSGCRIVAGASLGGVSALQIGLAHPGTFGLVLAFSPVLRDPAIAGFLTAAWRDPGVGPSRVLVDLDDDAPGTADRHWLERLVATAAVPGRELLLSQPPGARHRLASWALRAVPALRRLLDGRCG
jgi:S-formylglutathione hydrolase FrmB